LFNLSFGFHKNTSFFKSIMFKININKTFQLFIIIQNSLEKKVPI